MSFYQGAKRLTPVLAFIFNVRCEGTENMPESGPVILCSNHRSNVDPVIIGVVFRRSLFFMAKDSLFRIPLLGSLIKALGAFPVTRGAHDMEAIKKSMKILRGGNVLAMFPEGHRQKNYGKPKRFQSGVVRIAEKTNSVILPAAVICKRHVMPFNRKYIRVGKPVTLAELGVTDGGKENIARASERLREIVERLMEEPVDKKKMVFPF